MMRAMWLTRCCESLCLLAISHWDRSVQSKSFATSQVFGAGVRGFFCGRRRNCTLFSRQAFMTQLTLTPNCEATVPTVLPLRTASAICFRRACRSAWDSVM